MISPFPGLSTVVHIMIIVVKRTGSFAFGPSKPENKKTWGSKAAQNFKNILARVFSVLIIEFVILFMAVTCFTVLAVGIQNKNSNFKIIGSYIYKVRRYYAESAPNLIISPIDLSENKI